MSKIDEVAEGYWNLMMKNEGVEELAKVRNEICNTCPSNSKNQSSMFGDMLPYCKECGCLLEAKTRSPESSCPLKKW